MYKFGCRDYMRYPSNSIKSLAPRDSTLNIDANTITRTRTPHIIRSTPSPVEETIPENEELTVNTESSLLKPVEPVGPVKDENHSESIQCDGEAPISDLISTEHLDNNNIDTSVKDNSKI